MRVVSKRDDGLGLLRSVHHAQRSRDKTDLSCSWVGTAVKKWLLCAMVDGPRLIDDGEPALQIGILFRRCCIVRCFPERDRDVGCFGCCQGSVYTWGHICHSALNSVLIVGELDTVPSYSFPHLMCIAVQANLGTLADHIVDRRNELPYAWIVRSIDADTDTGRRIHVYGDHRHLERNMARSQIVRDISQDFEAFWVKSVPRTDVFKANESDTYWIG